VDDAHDGSYAREPQLDDLVRLARALNAHHVRYVLIGGFAVIAHGGARTTKDIDLLIDAGPVNVARVRDALQILEDKAVNEVADEDVSSSRKMFSGYTRCERRMDRRERPCRAGVRRANRKCADPEWQPFRLRRRTRNHHCRDLLRSRGDRSI
jgi:hypothetical protein